MVTLNVAFVLAGKYDIADRRPIQRNLHVVREGDDHSLQHNVEPRRLS